MRGCGIDKREKSLCLLMFEDVDSDHNGLIDMEEILSKLDRSSQEDCRTFLLLEIFQKMDPPKEMMIEKFEQVEARSNGLRLSYVDFFAAAYNFCTLDRKGLVQFTFEMMLTLEEDVIHRDDIVELTRRLFLKKNKKKVDKLVEFLEDEDGRITFEDFLKFRDRMSLLVFPVFRLQVALRKCIIGNSFWNRHQKRRSRLKGLDPVREFLFATGRAQRDDLDTDDRPVKKQEDETNAEEGSIAAEDAATEDLKEEDDSDVKETPTKKEDVSLEEASKEGADEKSDGRRQGEWWIENACDSTPAISSSSDALKLIVQSETADVLEAADVSRRRAESMLLLRAQRGSTSIQTKQPRRRFCCFLSSRNPLTKTTPAAAAAR